MLLVEKSMVGFKTRRMKVQGIAATGTSYITFDNIKVPLVNLIGDEGNGFMQSMFNFNQERFGIALCALGSARTVFSESMKFAMKRITFGKRLIDHAVIRNKLGNMIRQIEATHAMAEQIAYQLNNMSPLLKINKLPGAISLYKVQCTQLVNFCAKEAIQIFGGLG